MKFALTGTNLDRGLHSSLWLYIGSARGRPVYSSGGSNLGVSRRTGRLGLRELVREIGFMVSKQMTTMMYDEAVNKQLGSKIRPNTWTTERTLFETLANRSYNTFTKSFQAPNTSAGWPKRRAKFGLCSTG